MSDDYFRWLVPGNYYTKPSDSGERLGLREAAEAALTDFVYAHGSDFDPVEWPGMAALRDVLDSHEHAPARHPDEPRYPSDDADE